jgi:1-phosphofructokinase
MSIITVTLSPAMDQTVVLPDLVHGAVHRADEVRYTGGGKGINVASCLADWGVPVIATGLLGTENADPFDALLATKRIGNYFVRAPGFNRVNIKLVDNAGTTDINLPALQSTPDGLEAVTSTVLRHSAHGGQVVIAGSLPMGCEIDYYACMIAALADRGVRVTLDTSGPALAAVLAASQLPYAIKPNRDELAAWAGHPLNSVADLAGAAVELQRRGIALVVVSMGADGALFVSDDQVQFARLQATASANTVGAGDAMVAGIVAAIAEGSGIERIARLSTAFAVGKLSLAGAHLPDRSTLNVLAEEVILTSVAGAGA